MSTVLLLTGSAPRHLALAATLIEQGVQVKAILSENGYSPYSNNIASEHSSVIFEHFKEREATENAIFSYALDFFNPRSHYNCLIKSVPLRSFRGPDFDRLVAEIGPDIIAVYGTSIIKGNVIDSYAGRILNLHLGLSPYYRGSGTLFYPYLNQESFLSGSTFMLLDAGIDTGSVVHQRRLEMDSSKSFHENCCYHMADLFSDYSRILLDHKSILLTACRHRSIMNWAMQPRRYYRDCDFDEHSLIKAMQYFYSQECLADSLNAKKLMNYSILSHAGL